MFVESAAAEAASVAFAASVAASAVESAAAVVESAAAVIVASAASVAFAVVAVVAADSAGEALPHLFPFFTYLRLIIYNKTTLIQRFRYYRYSLSTYETHLLLGTLPAES